MKRYLELSELFGEKSIDQRMIELAQRLKAYRKTLRMTQLQLSDRSGVPYGTVKLFERTGKVSLDALFRICIALGCDDQLDDLFTRPKITLEEIRGGI